jgi:hypothetical protein
MGGCMESTCNKVLSSGLGSHKPMADFYGAQRDAGGPVGPGGPFWPREDFNAPNVSLLQVVSIRMPVGGPLKIIAGALQGHGVRHYPDYVRSQFAEGAVYSADGQLWPKPTFAKLMPGDAVLILGHTVRARPGRLSAIGIFVCKSVLYGAFVWARRALNVQKRRFPARADARREPLHGGPAAPTDAVLLQSNQHLARKRRARLCLMILSPLIMWRSVWRAV